jgi:hypothetical protein
MGNSIAFFTYLAQTTHTTFVFFRLLPCHGNHFPAFLMQVKNIAHFTTKWAKMLAVCANSRTFASSKG